MTVCGRFLKTASNAFGWAPCARASTFLTAGIKSFLHYKPGKTNNTLRSGYVSSLIEDKSGNIWVGTDLGIDVLDGQSGTFRHL